MERLDVYFQMCLGAVGLLTYDGDDEDNANCDAHNGSRGKAVCSAIGAGGSSWSTRCNRSNPAGYVAGVFRVGDGRKGSVDGLSLWCGGRRGWNSEDCPWEHEGHAESG